MKRKILAIGLASAIAVGLVVLVIRIYRLQKKRITVADAGYETAHDILFPLRELRVKRNY